MTRLILGKLISAIAFASLMAVVMITGTVIGASSVLLFYWLT